MTAETMKNILDLVLCRLLVSMCKPYIYEQTNIAVKFGDITFTASGRKPIDYGWTRVQERLLGKEPDEDKDAEKEQIFPDIRKGQTVTVASCNPVPKKTTPPKLHTEATLLTAMENAGATIEGGAIPKG